MTPNAAMPTSAHSQKWGGMARVETFPKTNARRRSARAWFSEGSPRSLICQASVLAAATGAAHATDHEAHVRVAGKRCGLEHALDDQSLNLAIHLEHHHAAELLAGVQLLPQLTLVLEDVEQLVHALQTVRLHDGAGVAGGGAVHQDLRARDGDHRRVRHIDDVLGVRQLHVLVDRELTAGREA